ncbi:MAG: peptide chain release factor N(5)-glutamine methyltransferase [Chloroflexi bacterium]|nr:peptide chain release factor N(5)-glutamine methyltransferase [Chloroflexota bacterium]
MVLTTAGEALRRAAQRLSPVSDSAASDAQALLRRVLAVDRAALLAHPERPLDPAQAAAFEDLIGRAAAGEPLPYILGRWPFYDRDFIVTPAVLIPRPETELLLEQALAFSVDRALTAIDVGTGSGALAVTLAALRPRAEVFATDASADALAVARQNASLYDVPVTFLLGDLLNPLIERRVHSDLVMANLPYIPSDEVDRLPVSKHEPRQALDGGRDGLDLIAV